MPKYVWLKINGCMECPNCEHVPTTGAGSAVDYICKKKKSKVSEHGFKLIAGYVENYSEMPKKGDIPIWCPLKEKH